MEGFVQFLAGRLAGQQEIINSLLTANSEWRLASALLRLGQRLGSKGPGNCCIEQRISHEELGAMVGTTRSRIGFLLKRFQKLGLAALTSNRHLVINEAKLRQYMLEIALDAEARETRTSRRAEPDHPGRIPANGVASGPATPEKGSLGPRSGIRAGTRRRAIP